MPERPAKSSRWGKLWQIPLYPLLFGIFSVLSLAANNLSQQDLSNILRSALFSVLLPVILLTAFRLLLRDWKRAAFLTFALLVLFYTFGHVYNLLLDARLFKSPPAGEIPLLLVWIGFGALTVWLTLRRPLALTVWTPALNIFSIVLLAFPLYQLVNFGVRQYSLERAREAANPVLSLPPAPPDIYYIILDAYSRADTLQRVYDYDNTAFLQALDKRGFYIALCSQSNYAYTEPSLASSLNMEYLDTLSVDSDAEADALIQDNFVRRYLKSQGYTIVAFETGFRWTQWEDADVYYRYRPEADELNGFESLFLRTTMLRLPLDLLLSNQIATYGELPYNRVRFVLDTFKKVPTEVKSPKFVFVHLSVPHPPFVFGPNGELVTAGAENSTSIEGYRNSLNFINQQILQVVDSIQSKPGLPSIIIIQGDHGAPRYNSPSERMAILYTIYGESFTLQPASSPVNTFRMIFNNEFNQHYPLLENISYYSPTNSIYDFEAIPGGCDR